MVAALLFSLMPNKPETLPVIETTKTSPLNKSTPSVKKAIELVKTGASPMEGITMLKDIIEKDSTNIEAIAQLGFFSIQSGQLDKAIMRFKQIEKLDPERTDVLYFLGNIYVDKGENTIALDYFKKFKSKNKDTKLNLAIDKQIESLTIKTN